MNTPGHNDLTDGAPGLPSTTLVIGTLGDLAAFIKTRDELPAARKRSLIWALNTAIRLLGDGRADVVADPSTVLRQLERTSPAMAGLSRQSFANLKSLVRTAFRIARPHLPAARARIKLTGPWADAEALLDERAERELSRLLRYAQATGWTPGEIDEERVQRFEVYLRDEVMLARYDEVIRNTRRAWNHAVATVPGWPGRPIAPPMIKRRPYWVQIERLAVPLQQEIAGFLHRLAHPDPFLGQGKALAPSTITQFRFLFITLASALIASGVPAERLTSIASLVQPDNLERALRFLYARAGERVNDQIYALVYRARKIAAQAGSLPDEEVVRLDAILAAIKRKAPFRRGLVEKNRRLLEHLEDVAFVDRLLTLPARLMQTAQRATARRYMASCARDALAIELLLTCSMRVGNLVDLRLGETIRRYGEGQGARWVIDIPAEKVKNGQPLRYTLLPESVRLLEWYLAHCHHLWRGPGSPWLFPGSGDGHVDARFLSESIARRAHRHVGVRITCHQFRHLAAELYLREDPNGLGIVSQHLGHKDLNTTRRFYAREQTRIATQRYHEVLERKRAAAGPRRKPRQSGDAA